MTSLAAALTPIFVAATSTADGFTVQISNYNGAFTYGGTATAGSVSISETGLVTVSRVGANTSSTATITTTRANYVSGSAQVTATSNIVPLDTATPSPSSSRVI
jgi:titin